MPQIRNSSTTGRRRRGGRAALVGCLVALAAAPAAHAATVSPGDSSGPSQAGRGAEARAARSHAAWYVGRTSAGSRIDFRLSRSGGRVRDFHFGAPTIRCADVDATDTLVDGNFPLVGIRVRGGAFEGSLQAEDDTPSTPDQMGVWVRGRFDDRRHVSGTIDAASRSCSFERLSFSAERAGPLPGAPARGRAYAGRTVRGSAVSFRVSRSGRLTAFRLASVSTFCSDSDGGTTLRLAHSYPESGLRRGRSGSFAGVLSSRRSKRGPLTGTRVRISVLFLSRREATGTVRRLGNKCRYETIPFRTQLD